jgi:glucokinase
VVPSFCADKDNPEQITAEGVAVAARSGDHVALEIMQIVGRRLGLGLAMLIDILNPEAIVIGSIFARQHDLLWPIAERVIAEEALPMTAGACRVLPAALGEAIGDYASLSVAANGE